ncbi:dipeptidase PepE [bacterium]|nr:MAG: dipeptidase PepE [bacterium]
MRLLLISNSTNYGGGFLDHCAGEIKDFLGEIRSILFVPYALNDLDGYTAKTRERYAKMGIDVRSIHEFKDPGEGVKTASAIHIGGGNTFRLLKRMYDEKIITVIREKVQNGMPYIGASAGTNVATVSIKTTNDMPIVYPPTFDALGLVPFNINPHYIDPDPNSTHQGETREQRINEFHEMNDTVVVGLREGAWLRIEGASVMLGGINGTKIFRKNEVPAEYKPGANLDFLLK